MRLVNLTTRGRKSGKPRTVKIWFVVAGPTSIYVQHTNPKPADWYRNLMRDPSVSVDFGTGQVAARATPVSDAEGDRTDPRDWCERKYLAAWIFKLLGWTDPRSRQRSPSMPHEPRQRRGA